MEDRFVGRRQRVFVAVQVGFLLLALVFFVLRICFKWSPAPGIAVAVMAFAAAAMSTHSHMNRYHKALWMLIIGAFLVVEILAIERSQADLTEQQQTLLTEERKHFGEIGDGIKTAIAQSDQDFSETMKKFGENIETVTGGNSFCYLSDAGTLSILQLVAVPQGKYPLYDVGVRIVDIEMLDQTKNLNTANILSKNLGNFSPKSGEVVANLPIPANTDTEKFNVFFSGRNGFWTQLLRRRRIGGTWETATLVYGALDSRYPKGAILFSRIAKEFPKDQLKNDDDWTNALKLPKALN